MKENGTEITNGLHSVKRLLAFVGKDNARNLPVLDIQQILYRHSVADCWLISPLLLDWTPERIL